MKRLLVLMFFLLIMFSYNAYSCGCGIALGDIKVFNQLKETQAYLLIDVTGPNTYTEMPFFRMISMEEPQDVTIVFPINQVPYDVQGKTISAGEFLQDYQITQAETSMKKQSFSNLVKKIGSDFKEVSGKMNFFTNGLFVAYLSMYFGTLGNKADYSQNGLVARFEFEGGAMEIYDIDSMDTLSSLVEKLNLTTSGEVERLVNKYNDYYVAVLYLKVEAVLNATTLQKLNTQCPVEFRQVKALLQEETSPSQRDLSNIIYGKNYVCSEELSQLVAAATYANHKVKGTLVQMYFEGTDEFFYPTSIVNSYNYPVTDQKYFVKTPKKLHAELSSSKVANVGVLGPDRWYQVTSTEEDLKGNIVEAPFGLRLEDDWRIFVQLMYNISFVFVIFVYLLIIILPFKFIRKEEIWTKGDIITAVAVSVFFGLFISGIVMMLKKKAHFGLILLTIWFSFIALSILANVL